VQLNQLSASNKTLQNMQNKQVLSVFGGLNTGLRIPEGEWNEEHGVSARNYPVLSTAKPGADTVYETARAAGMVAVHTTDGKSYIAVVTGNGVTFYGNGSLNNQHYNLGLTSASENDLTEQKQVVCFGAYILIWPDKKYINVNQVSDRGAMAFEGSAADSFTIEECREDGSSYTHRTVSATEPSNPVDGDAWIDTSTVSTDGFIVLKEYKATVGEWITVTQPYVKLVCSTNNKRLVEGDVVDISGIPAETTIKNRMQDGQYVVEKSVVAYTQTVTIQIIVVKGIYGSTSAISGDLSVKRSIPDMDYVTVCENRVWGCKYGVVNGENINEIYASKLGDFKNWYFYQGLSIDSYAASRGSDGPFTGAITYRGHPLFFKENYLEQVYVSSSGAHQIVTTSLQGIQSGCWRSAVIINDILYYKSRDGFYAYNGSTPRCISRKLGDLPLSWNNVCAGYEGDVLYVQHGTNVLAYDTQLNIWHRAISEGTYEIVSGFVNKDGELYASWRQVRVGPGPWATVWQLHKFNADTTSGAISWSIKSGVIGLDLAEQEYISRFVIRFATKGSMTLKIQYDAGGTWEDRGTIPAGDNEKIRTYVLNVSPRRCDTCRIWLYGTKKCDIYSITKYIERGSDAAYQ